MVSAERGNAEVMLQQANEEDGVAAARTRCIFSLVRKRGRSAR